MSIIKVENRKIDSYPEELRNKLREVFGASADATDTHGQLRYILERCGAKAASLISGELLSKACSESSFKIVRDDFLEEYLIKVRRHDSAVEELEFAFILAINAAYQKIKLVEDSKVYIEALGLHLQSNGDIENTRKGFADIEGKADEIRDAVTDIRGKVNTAESQLLEICPAFHMYEEGTFLKVKAMPPEVTQELSDIKQQLLELQEAVANITKRVTDGPVQG